MSSDEDYPSKDNEFIPGGYPVTPEHEKTGENNVGNNDTENNYVEDRAESNDAEDKKESNDVEDKSNGVEDKESDGVKDKAESDGVKDKAESDGVKDKAESDDVKDKAESDDVKDKAESDMGNKTENKDVENKGHNVAEEKSAENKAVESFPLKFRPDPSMKPADDNNLAMATTNKGSSALGGVGINPANLEKTEPDDSPPHPFYHGSQPQAFDLNGDYNEQKEKEQIADQQEQDKLDHKPSEKRQRFEDKNDKRIDLGVKPLGNQPLPSPYKPENDEDKAPIGNTVHKQKEGTRGEGIPPGKTTAVHPENLNVGPRVTKKDKINATIDKAVGTFKEKFGKLIKNDNLAAKGAEEKEEADKTKELAEVQKKMNELL